MTAISRRFKTAAALLMLGVGAAIGYQAFGSAMLAGQPTAVVTVNLAAVLEKLDQRAEAVANIKAMAEKMRGEDETRKAELTKMEKEIKEMEDSAGREELMDKFRLAVLNYQAWMRFTEDKMDIEASLVLRDLYRSIKIAVGQMAVTAKFDVVLVDDSQGELSLTEDTKVSREIQVRQQIAGRRMLYTNPTLDITDDLIVRMNNAFKTKAKTAP